MSNNSYYALIKVEIPYAEDLHDAVNISQEIVDDMIDTYMDNFRVYVKEVGTNNVGDDFY